MSDFGSSVQAALLAVGDELLDGRTIDTNSAMIAAALLDDGIPVVRKLVIGDPVTDIVDGLRILAERARLIIVTGGIGPTEDDRTRDAVARFAGRELVFDADAWTSVQSWFAHRGRPAPEANRRQAEFPEGAEILPNRAGTAPGFRVEVDGPVDVFVLPGVPSEARIMFDEQVRPRLVGAGVPLVQDYIAFTGVSESHLGALFASYLREREDLRTGMTASDGLIRVCVRAVGEDRAASTHRVRTALDEFRELGAKWFVGEGKGNLEDFLVTGLIDRDITLALAESCTAGLTAARIGSVPGASAVFLEAVVTYTNQAKVARLDVAQSLLDTDGAVSESCARAMAEGLAARTGARLTGSITGIAGPDGGTEAKPVGLVHFATTLDGNTTHKKRLYGPLGRNLVRARAASELLSMLFDAVRD